MHLPSDIPLPQSLLCPGTCLLQRYRIVRLLGHGGMGYVFEVTDEDYPDASPKILKVLHDDRSPLGTPPSPKILEYFRREAKVLKELDCKGIPKVFPEDDYFCECLSNSSIEPGKSIVIHGFVMEKIPGETLASWLANPQNLLVEDQAIQWLEQLSNTLDYLHRNGVIHRDIKPSNIMLRPNGELVLIDFGIAREMTETYYARRRNNRTGTPMWTPEYAAPEQHQSRQVTPQTDFYALGKTVIRLLAQATFAHQPTINNEYQASSDEANWNADFAWQSAPINASPSLRALLQWMTHYNDKRRPRNARVILRSLQRIKRDRDPVQRRRELPWVILGSIATTALTLGIRSLGWLQPLELAAFDHFMRLRPPEPPDPRITIITIDDEDRTWQRNQGMQAPSGISLADEALRQLLEKLEKYDARVVGLDLYRDFKADSLDPRLLNLMGSDRLVALCKATGTESAPSIPPPQGASLVGFSDFYLDQDDIVRRQVISMTPPPDSNCPNHIFSFSSQVIFRYLFDDAITANLESNNSTMIGAYEFEHLQSPFAGYRLTHLEDGEQIMINYRSARTTFDIANQIPLRTFLDGSISPNLVRNKIVFIGVVDQAFDDFHSTPLGILPGVVVHAHMTSQVISHIEDGRPMIWTLNGWLERLWIFHWVFLSLYISWLLRFLNYSILGSVICTSAIAYCFCLSLFLRGGWLPVIPSIAAIILSHLPVVTFYVSCKSSWLLGWQKQ